VRTPVLCVLLLIACQSPATDSQKPRTASIGISIPPEPEAPKCLSLPPSQACCDEVVRQSYANYSSILTRLNACCTAHHDQILKALCVQNYQLDGCPQPPPPPVPVATGGVTGAGGARATGGKSGTGGTKSTGGATSAGGAPVGSKCDQACANLKKLGCPDGQDPVLCLQLCALHTTDSRFTQDLDCRITAKTIAAAQKCGPASCQ
jgi:hypothetical protein